MSSKPIAIGTWRRWPFGDRRPSRCRSRGAVPERGEPLTIAGYGSGNYRAQSGRCTQYLAPGPNMPYDIVEVSAAARHGDSGGPILNARGELAGVLFGEGGGRTAGSAAARVRWFVASVVLQPSTDKPTQIAQSTTPSPPFAAAAPRMPASSLPSPSEGEGQGLRGRAAAEAGIQPYGDLVAVAPPMANLPPVTYPTTDAPPLALPSQNQSSEARRALVPRKRTGRTYQRAARRQIAAARLNRANLHVRPAIGATNHVRRPRRAHGRATAQNRSGRARGLVRALPTQPADRLIGLAFYRTQQRPQLNPLFPPFPPVLSVISPISMNWQPPPNRGRSSDRSSPCIAGLGG